MSAGWIFLAVSVPAFLVLGVVLGFLLSDETYRRTLSSLGHFATRVVCKACLRTIDPRHGKMLESVDMKHAALSTHEKLGCADPSALKAIGLFKDRLMKIYGEDVSAVYFFGSRMRGTHTFWSDLDVVVLFRPTVSLVRARQQVKREVFQILLEHGLLIQLHLASDQAIHSINTDLPPIIRRAVRTGIQIE